AFKKVSKIHSKLPPGGILVFLTGQQEIEVLVRKLRRTFDRTTSSSASSTTPVLPAAEQPDEDAGLFDEMEDVGRDDFEIGEEAENDEEEDGESEEEDVEVLGGISDDEGEEEALFVPPAERGEEAMPLHVLPLYSLLPTQAQLRVFEDPPPGTRLCVIATNVAETSITIPGIKYVVDCGKVKERRYDTHTSVQTFQIGWTSRSSADQRAGRAGRVGPGHCYRLFSSAVFNDYFQQFSKPEILRVPIEGVVLSMKSMGINQIVGFPFPTPPGKDNLRSAEKLLMHLGALDSASPKLRITDLGKLMGRFPVSPRFAKMLIVASQQPGNLLAFVIAMVAGLSVGDPFIRDQDVIGDGKADDDDSDGGLTEGEKEERKKKRGKWFKVMQILAGDPPTSDSIRILRAIGAYTAEQARSPISASRFCKSHFLRPKAMEEIAKLRSQLTNLAQTSLPATPSVSALCLDPQMPPPSARETVQLRQILLAGLADNIARLDDTFRGSKGSAPVYVTAWGTKHEQFRIHPASALSQVRPPPRWIAYEEVAGREERIAADNSHAVDVRGTDVALSGGPGGEPRRIWLKGITVLDEAWLPQVLPASLCRDGKILEQPAPRWEEARDDVIGFAVPFVAGRWELAAREVTVRGTDGAKAFAKALVEGRVFAGCGKAKGRSMAKGKAKDIFGMLEPYLTTKPAALLKEWSKTQTKISSLVTTLAVAEVQTRASLLAKWKTEPAFLLPLYLAWVPAEFHLALRESWPPVAASGEPLPKLVKALTGVMTRGDDDKKGSSHGRTGGESEDDSDF
ncbi:hypothetical protein BDK51DRAFT_29854, partial [Blyttiomyces helicus]